LGNTTKLVTQYIPKGEKITLRSTLKAISELPTALCKVSPACDLKTHKLDPTSNTCVVIDSPAATEKACPAPSYIDNSGKCVSAAESKKDLCASGNYILLGGKGCGAKCGANQVAKMGMCVCQTDFIPDPANAQNCIVNPALNEKLPAASPSSGGGSCSLVR
jgi:hypothetical protein